MPQLGSALPDADEPISAHPAAWDPVTTENMPANSVGASMEDLDLLQEEGLEAAGASALDAPAAEEDLLPTVRREEGRKPSARGGKSDQLDDNAPFLTIKHDNGREVTLSQNDIIERDLVYQNIKRWQSELGKESRVIAGARPEIERAKKYKGVLDALDKNPEFQDVLYMRLQGRKYKEIIQLLNLDGERDALEEPEMYDSEGRLNPQYLVYYGNKIRRDTIAEIGRTAAPAAPEKKDPMEGMTGDEKLAYLSQHDPVFRGNVESSEKFKRILLEEYGIAVNIPDVQQKIADRVSRYLYAAGQDVTKVYVGVDDLVAAFRDCYPKEAARYDQFVARRSAGGNNRPKVNDVPAAGGRAHTPQEGFRTSTPDAEFY